MSAATTTSAPAAAAGAQAFATNTNVALYVGDLHPEVNEAVLYDVFSAAGPVQSVRVNRDANQRSLLYAYVNFQTHQEAENAMTLLNHKEIKGKPCRIAWAQRDASQRKSNIGNLCVKNLAPSVTARKLEDVFAVIGNVTSCKISMNDKGESNGYGFVNFLTAEEAAAAIKKFNNTGFEIDGKVLQVENFKSQKERGATARSAFTNVFVKSLPEAWTNADLEKYFSQFGQITSSMLAFDEEKKASKMFGFVNFATPEQAAAAIDKANNVEIDGKKIFVGRAQKREERARSLKASRDASLAEQRRKSDGTNLYVKNLPEDVTADRLRDFFSKFGTVASPAIASEGGRSKGFGFVSFATQEEATKALTESNNSTFFGKPLYVSIFQDKEARRAHNEARRANAFRMQQQQAAAIMMMPAAFRNMAGVNMNMFPQGMFPQGMRGPWGMVGPNGLPMFGMPMAGARGNAPQQGPRGAPGQRGPGRQGAPGARPPAFAQPGQMVPGGRGPQRGGAPGPMGQQVRQPRQVPTAIPAQTNMPLDPAALAAMDEGDAKNAVGERLYPLVVRQKGEELAPKLTGMLLEMELSEVLALLDSQEELRAKVEEAYAVYANAMQTGN